MSHAFLGSLFSLEGKAALITGATGGLGRVLAATLAQAGAEVAVSGRSPAQLAAVTRELSAFGRRVTALPADLSAVAACRDLVQAAQTAFGRLDILVNCAGVNERRPISEVSPEAYEALMAVNLRSIFFLCQAAQARMRAQGGGKIINIGSLTSTIGLGTVSVYGAAKAGLSQLTKTMAVEWARDNIQVNCLAPGFMLTPLTEGPLWGDPVRRRWLTDRIPARRPGQPPELSGALLLLASPASSYLTGQTLTVDGGVLAGGSWENDHG